VPAKYDDDFFDNAGASLSKLSVASLNMVSLWSARNSKSGFVSAVALARYSDDPEGFVRELAAAGIAQKRPKGAMQIIPGMGVLIENAVDAAKIAAEAAETEAAEREKAARLKEADNRRHALLRDPVLKEAIRKRDKDLCRYCGVAVRWGKGQAADSGQYDPVDPGEPNSLGNLVTACRACGVAKDRRPLAEAGMVLLDAPAARGSRHASEGAGSMTRSMTRSMTEPAADWPQSPELGKRARSKGGRKAARHASRSMTEPPSRARADQDLNQDLDDFELDPSLVSQSSAVDAGAGARGAGDDELIDSVIAAVAEREFFDLDRPTALKVGVMAVSRRKKGPPTDRAAYAAAVIANEKDLYAELLREVAPPRSEIFAERDLPPGGHPFKSDGAPVPTCLTCSTPEGNYRHDGFRQEAAAS
jgi:5-methylcytosine-specific restriction endonuclease McrA